MKEANNQEKIPFNCELEQKFLGLLISKPEVISHEGVSITVDDLPNVNVFYIPIHQKIYSLFLKHVGNDLLIEISHLAKLLDKEPLFTEVQGINYLYRISAGGDVFFSLKYAVEVLTDLALRREMIEIADSLKEKASDIDIDLSAAKHLNNVTEILINRTLEIENKKQTDIRPIKSYLPAFKEELKENLAGKNLGIMSGINALDEMTDGFKRGQLIIIGARPSVGKTSLALYLMSKFSRQIENEICFFSMEMGSDEIIKRIISIENGYTVKELMAAGNIEKILNYLNELGELNMSLDVSTGMSIDEISRKAISHSRKKSIGFLCIDYIQLLGSSGYLTNKTLAMTDVSRKLKELARTLNIPIVVLSQLSRKSEDRVDKKPQLSDLRDSGSLEQDADIVMLLHKDQKKPDKLEINLAKNRTGAIGSVLVGHSAQTGRIYEI